MGTVRYPSMLRNARHTSVPSICGISRSSRKASTCKVLARAMACSPESARTTSYPSGSSMHWRTVLAPASSSMMRIVRLMAAPFIPWERKFRGKFGDSEQSLGVQKLLTVPEICFTFVRAGGKPGSPDRAVSQRILLRRGLPQPWPPPLDGRIP